MAWRLVALRLHARTRLAAFTQSPALFALAVVAIHLLMVLPILAHHSFDASVLIVAGDKFVSAGHTPTAIIIRPHSDGYDGQFYYRLALAPFLPQANAFGITLDHPAWRAQRILLPLLVRLVSCGNPAALPWAFFLVNLTGIAAISAVAALLARRLALPCIMPVAIAFWPSWLIALTHDTTEITAAALLLAAIAAYLSERLILYAVLIALASLARETAILAALGITLFETWRVLSGPAQRAWRHPLIAAAAMLPFLAWRQTVSLLWHSAPQEHGVAHNAGWPFLGWAEAVLANVTNHAIGAAAHPQDLIMRATMLAGAVLLGLFCASSLRASAYALRARIGGAIATSWLLVFALISLLTANGPWIEPTAFLRAFSECWVLGWVVMGLTSRAIIAPILCSVLGAFLVLRNWELCWIQLR